MCLWTKLYRLSKFGRSTLLKTACSLEGGVLYSQTFRKILLENHGVEIGLYTYGSPLFEGVFPRGTRIGRYVSLANGMEVFRRNHPLDRVSTHPFFYNAHLGVIDKDSIEASEDNPLSIGHDVWVGSRVTILPACRFIGTGAVIGAGAVVTRDVQPFAVVGGNPARFIKWRHSREIIEMIEQSSWWNNDLDFLRRNLPSFLMKLCDSNGEFPSALESIRFESKV